MKKKINILFAFLIASLSTFAQSQYPHDLPKLFVSDISTVHFISPEPIQYVDISTNHFVGDIPVDNILRVKYLQDTSIRVSDIFDNNNRDILEAIVTIVGQSFYAQYRLIHTSSLNHSGAITSVEILPDQMRALEFPEITMTRTEMEAFSLKVLKRKRSFFNVTSKENGMVAQLNNIFSFGDYVFIDVSFKNHTKIKYDVDEFRFNIKDKRIAKATNVQDIEIKPAFTLYEQPYFRKDYRNVFVFKKFTYPNDKVLSLQMTEDQISGRTIELRIDYRDLLNADTL
ncbi:MAG: conjugative transposon protein TraN [Olivibacter sp.]|nr:conjugative transposon protein TraN [Olivibacter sp. UJ_SKK_5.1]